VTERINVTASDDWQQLDLAFKADSAGYVNVSIENYSAKDVWFDDLRKSPSQRPMALLYTKKISLHLNSIFILTVMIYRNLIILTLFLASCKANPLNSRRVTPEDVQLTTSLVKDTVLSKQFYIKVTLTNTSSIPIYLNSPEHHCISFVSLYTWDGELIQPLLKIKINFKPRQEFLLLNPSEKITKNLLFVEAKYDKKHFTPGSYFRLTYSGNCYVVPKKNQPLNLQSKNLFL
jgi:hypothetical protein